MVANPIAIMLMFLGGGIAAAAHGAFDVRDFGAKGDGVAKDTAAVQKAIDAAHAAGGGEVLLLKGVYLCGSLFLKSGVDFHLEEGAVLKGSPDPTDYNVLDIAPQNRGRLGSGDNISGGHLVLCVEQENVTLRGPGKIDGNVGAFLKMPDGSHPPTKLKIPWRPAQMLWFVESRHVAIRDIEIADAPYWSCFIYGCEDVVVEMANIHTVRNPHTYNGDGLDIDSSRHVRVAGCHISTADDSITLRAAGQGCLKNDGPCADVVVSNCIFSSDCNAIRLGVGNGVIRDCSFTGIRIENTRYAVNAVGAWSRPEHGVDISNIVFRDIAVDARGFCKFYYKHATESVFDGIAFRHVRGKVREPSIFDDTPERPFRNLVFEDVKLEGETSPRVAMPGRAAVALACCGAAATGADALAEIAASGRLSVRDFGAKGDGVTDDTAAIQAGLDYLASRGGGKLYFPFTTNGYLVASPAREYAANGRLVRAQIVIPPGFRHNIRLEGEMPCKLLYSYQVRPKGCEKAGFKPTVFGSNLNINTMLHSTWDAPEVTDPKERPWAVIAAPEGDSCAGKFSVGILSFANLEIRVHLDRDKMYPTTSAANFHNISRLIVEDAQFCLDENVGDTNLGKELQPNPCQTVGLMASGDQNDDQIFRNVAAQGFKYGFVFGEHTCAEHLYVHNCEYAISFADATHPAIINRVVAQHNTRIFCTLPDGAFGRRASWVNLIVNECDYETGSGTRPVVSQMQYGVFDPDNRFRGKITYLQGWPGDGRCFFPVEGGSNIVTRVLGGD